MSAHHTALRPRDFTRLYVVGAGGHGREIAWLARQCWDSHLEIIHLVDDPKYLPPGEHAIGLLGDAQSDGQTRFVVAIGDAVARRRLAAACEHRGLRAATLIHPGVELSASVEVAEGAVVCAGTVLTTNAHIGRHAHVNIGCTISHDVEIGEFATLSPGVHVAGHVSIGAEVFIGIGANIVNGRPDRPLSIGDRAVIAAGACVTGDVACGAMMAGVPALRKR